MDTPDNAVMIAREGFACEIDGQQHIVQAGVTRVAAGHELVKRFPERFGRAGDRLTYDVEDASAEPGSRRARAVAR